MSSASSASFIGKKITRILLRIAIILFCLWHMFAVLVFSTPRIATDRVSVFAIQKLIPVVMPYLHITSQWQLWNMFAPDPLRRVTTFHIDADRGNGWELLVDFRPGTFEWWRHSTYFKFFDNIFDPFDHSKDRVKIRFVQMQCAQFDLPPATPVRLRYRYYILPLLSESQSSAWWKAWTPQWEEMYGLETTCPTPSL